MMFEKFIVQRQSDEGTRVAIARGVSARRVHECIAMVRAQ